MTSLLNNHDVLCLENNPSSGTSDMPNVVINIIEVGNNAIYQFYLINSNDVSHHSIINHQLVRDVFSSSDFALLWDFRKR